VWRIKAGEAHSTTRWCRSALSQAPNIQEPFTGWPFLLPDLCPRFHFPDIRTASSSPRKTASPSVCGVSLIKSNQDDTSHLFHPRFVLQFYFSGEVDLCVYISAVPPPRRGIDVALRGLRLKERKERETDEEDEFSEFFTETRVQPGRQFVPL
ncbi:Hypothetical predicted protein, partial [Xyrichtys novacula]